jgi:DNA-binding CsgD family transcriptional regulator
MARAHRPGGETTLESAIASLVEGLQRASGGALMVRGEVPIDALSGLSPRLISPPERVRIVGAAAESDLAFAGLHQLMEARRRNERTAEADVGAVSEAVTGVVRDADDVARATLELLRPAPGNALVCVVHRAHLVDRASMEVLARLVEGARSEAIGVIYEVPFAADPPSIPDAATVVLPTSGADLHRRLLEMNSEARGALVVAATARRFRGGSRPAPARLPSPSALDEIERAGLIGVVRGEGPHADELARSVYSLATAADRRHAHHMLAAEAEADDARRVLHLAFSATGRDDALADLAAAWGAERRRAGRPGEAAEYLERAARLTADPLRGAERMTDAADARRAAGSMEEARALLRGARQLSRSVRVRVKSELVEGAIDYSAGELDSAYRSFVSSAGAAIDGDLASATESLSRAAEVAWWSGRADRAAELSAMLETLPSDGGDAAAFVLALLRGANRRLTGEGAAAGVELRLALRLADEIDAPRTAVLAGQAAFLLGDDRAAATQFRRAADEFAAAGDSGELSIVLQDSAAVAAWTGDLPAAGALIDRSIAETGGVNAFAWAVLAHVAALRGEAAECRRLVQLSTAAAAQEHFRGAAATAVWALGRLELGLGRPRVALEHLLGLADDESDRAHPLTALFAAPDVVEAAVRSGRTEVAERALADFEKWAAGDGHWVAVVAPRLRALLSDETSMIEAYGSAVRAAADAGLPFEEARARLLFGEHLRRRRQRTRAREQLREAITAFDAIGALPWAERARSELAASAETARARDGGARTALTDREREIAALVTAGASNHEVANRLFLSRKTVEYHLHQVYQKLGIGSRADLAAALHHETVERAPESS